MPPKAKKQKTKHSRPGGLRQSAHGLRVGSGHSHSPFVAKPTCPCSLPGAKFEGKHSPNHHEALPTTSNAGFFSIRIPNLRALVDQQTFELESARARCWLKTRETDQTIRAERKRVVEEERRRAVNSIKFAAFLSFKYGRTVEERQRVGTWLPHQIVQPRTSVPQTEAVTVPAPVIEDSNVLKPVVVPSAPPSVTEDTRSFENRNIVTLSLNKSPPIATHLITGLPTPPDSTTVNRFSLRKLSVQTPESEPTTPTSTHAMSTQPSRDLTGGVDTSIKDLIQQLFFLQQHISQFRNDKQTGLVDQAEEVARSIGRLEDQVSRPDNPLHNVTVAPEIIDYVEDGRNPDIFTRDFVELVQRGNSVMNGKQKAFKDFSKIYAKALKDNFDGLDEEVDMIMNEAGLVERNGKYVEKGLQNGNSG